MSAFEGGEDRFSLLLLEDGEYYFRDYNCHFWKELDHRVSGQLKVCSASLFFVPRDIHEPIMRLPYRTTQQIARSDEDVDLSGEDVIRVCTSERIEMKYMDCNAPYRRIRGDATCLFSLVYTSVEDILPRVTELWVLNKKDDTKEGRLEAKAALNLIVKAHEANEKFNPGWLEDENEHILLELEGSCITPLCKQPGRVVLTPSRLYFQPFNVVSNNPIQTYQIDQVKAIMKRTYQLMPTGIEVFFKGRTSLYLTFPTSDERDQVEATLKEQPAVELHSQKSASKWTRNWVKGKVSNFEYLMFLNRQAGRSFKDLTQYPIFPWIIQDYTSRDLDLNNPATFRDLSKPIGALNPARLAEYRDRYRELKRMCDATALKLNGSPPPLHFPPFLYGCHYSTPGYVVYYLMRSEPQLMLRLQNGRFDAPDRLFWSVLDTWKSVTSLSADVKELTPEFYSTDPAFLLNLENINFGTRASGEEVSDLELPPWATDAQDFVQKLAEALESPYVSAHLHRWIDLIFGYRSRGVKAEQSDNIFYYLTYDDIALQVLSREQDPVMREALRVQMVEFGRTPQQLFTRKHPRRRPVSRSKLTKFLCFRPALQPNAPQPSHNALGSTAQKGGSMLPIARAVARLTSAKPFIRQATLAWLEQAGMRQDPEYLCLASHTELLEVVRALREACSPSANQAADLPSTHVRALRVLAICPLNRSLILEAGALEPLTDLLCQQKDSELEAVVFTLSLLSKADDARLNAFPTAALERLLQLLRDDSSVTELRATAASTLARLSRAFNNRLNIAKADGLSLYLDIIFGYQDGNRLSEPPSREQLKVLKEAAAGLLALLEDEQTKLEVAERHAVPGLIGMCAQRSPDNDLRGTIISCLGSLSVNPAIRDEIAAEGALSVLCRAAKLRVVGIQLPVAAALANLCSSVGLLRTPESAEECLSALDGLSQSTHPEIQKHVARALWHLAAAGETRQLLAAPAPAFVLHRLASTSRSPQGGDLAYQALRRLWDDSSVLDKLPPEAQPTAGWLGALSPMSNPYVSPTKGLKSPEELSPVKLGSQAAVAAGKQAISPSKHRKHRRLQSAADDKGHGDVLSMDFLQSDSLDLSEDEIEASEVAAPRVLPALLNRIGLRKGGKGPQAEGAQARRSPSLDLDTDLQEGRQSGDSLNQSRSPNSSVRAGGAAPHGPSAQAFSAASPSMDKSPKRRTQAGTISPNTRSSLEAVTPVEDSFSGSLAQKPEARTPPR